MNSQMTEVMRRRVDLLARIASQREQVARIGACCEAPLALADRGLAVVRFLRARPVLVAGMTALVIIRRHGLIGLARSGWLAWRGYRYFIALSAKWLPRP